jgi:hypothetical protein
VWTSFPRHSPTWQVDHYSHLPKQKTTGQNIGKVNESGKKKLARWASGFVFLLANHEFYSTRIWWVGEWLSTPLCIHTSTSLIHFSNISWDLIALCVSLAFCMYSFYWWHVFLEHITRFYGIACFLALCTVFIDGQCRVGDSAVFCTGVGSPFGRSLPILFVGICT